MIDIQINQNYHHCHLSENKSDTNIKWPISGTSDYFEIKCIITPSLTNLPLQESKETTNCKQELIQFRKALNNLIQTPLCDEIYQKALSLDYPHLPPEQVSALIATTNILQELIEGEYPIQSKQEYASWAVRLLINHLEHGAILEEKKVQQLYHDLANSNGFLVTPRGDEASNNPSFLLQNTALFKIPKDTWEASHQRVIQNYPLYHTQTHALVGYEIDAILGFNRTPATVNLLFKKSMQSAIAQPNVANTECFSDLYEKPNTRVIFKTLNKGDVHITALSDIIEGIAAGHLGNYELVTNKGALRIQKFDLKESLIPFNKMPKEKQVLRIDVEELDAKKKNLEEELETLTNQKSHDLLIQHKIEELDAITKRLETERKTIIMARIVILGLPQCDRPFDKAALMTLCHPSLIYLMDGHHKNIMQKKYLIQPSALQAQSDRVIQLQVMAHEELQQETITLTPRQVFFALFGGNELYNLSMKKGYTPLQIFNNILGNCYRHTLSDFSRPETMKSQKSGYN